MTIQNPKTEIEATKKLEAVPSTIDSTDENNYLERLLQKFIDSTIIKFKKARSRNNTFATTSKTTTAVNPIILRCPQLAEIIELLLDFGWKIETKDINKNILVIEFGGIRYVVYLYFGEGADNAWIADKDDSNNEKPLWRSASTSVISPVSELMNYTDTLNADTESHHYPLLVIMYPNYIVNAEDMVQTYERTPIISAEKFRSFINNEDDFDRDEIDINDIGCQPAPIEDYDKTNNRLPQSAIEDNYVFEDEDTDNEGLEEINIKNVRFGTESYFEEHTIPVSESTLFCSMSEITLYLWFDIDGTPSQNTLYTCELRDKENNLIASSKELLERAVNECMQLNINTTLVDKYRLYIKHKDKELYSKELTFMDYRDGYEEYVDLESFGIYRMEDTDFSSDNRAVTERGAQSCFNNAGLEGILISSVFNNVSDTELVCKFSLTIKRYTHTIVYNHYTETSIGCGEQFTYTNIAQGAVCEAGDYTITLKFFGETVLKTNFTVGDRDIETSLKIGRLVAYPKQ